ncbi:hypothetical protein [Leisingera sp. ANG59]|uniref:hypothetical protein n=1 Tax=Leisingera sp. ANG59 TaxID=2675221 RepID=UPI001571EA24|nr:hypothetical protein [Leisingera sp. ANG59]NSY36839.1 hypothetical protein [Leisingera sp. ANG59]
MQIEQSDTAARFAETIAGMTGSDRRDTVACAVIETGGLYPYQVPPQTLVEIQLHGIWATGAGEDEAIDNWIAKARRAPSAPAEGE